MLRYEIIAFDPGQTTGFCLIEHHDGEQPFRLVMSGVFGWDDRFSTVHNLIFTHRTAIIVSERFTLYRNKAQDQIGQQFPSSQINGVIGAFTWLYGGRDLLLYGANVKDRVEILPEHQAIVHRSEHGRDAYKIARYELVRLQQADKKIERRLRDELT